MVDLDLWDEIVDNFLSIIQLFFVWRGRCRIAEFFEILNYNMSHIMANEVSLVIDNLYNVYLYISYIPSLFAFSFLLYCKIPFLFLFFLFTHLIWHYWALNYKHNLLFFYFYLTDIVAHLPKSLLVCLKLWVFFFLCIMA